MKLITSLLLALQFASRALASYSSGSSSSSSSSGSSYSSNAYGYNVFADSEYSYYDGHQQAWRMLGFYVDCDSSQGTCTRYLLWALVSFSQYCTIGMLLPSLILH